MRSRSIAWSFREQVWFPPLPTWRASMRRSDRAARSMDDASFSAETVDRMLTIAVDDRDRSVVRSTGAAELWFRDRRSRRAATSLAGRDQHDANLLARRDGDVGLLGRPGHRYFVRLSGKWRSSRQRRGDRPARSFRRGSRSAIRPVRYSGGPTRRRVSVPRNVRRMTDRASSTSSSWEPGQPGVCWPTGCRSIQSAPCC